MDADQLIDEALAKPGAYLDYPFGEGVACVRVRPSSLPAGLIMVQVFALRGMHTVTFRCDPMVGMMWRDLYPAVVVRGYHCPPVQQPYFNTLPLTGAVPDDDIREMLDQAWSAVVARLPRRHRDALSG